jgi:hypothetical protein
VVNVWLSIEHETIRAVVEAYAPWDDRAAAAGKENSR